MPDLFENSHRSYIRLSERMNCTLNIAHKIVGTQPTVPQSNELALWYGEALEPVVVRKLRKEGLACAFVNDEQLQLATRDPFSLGHPDGIVWAPFEPHEWPYWLKMNVPKSAQERLNNGESMLLEIKTMNAGAYRQFVTGGLASDPFLKKYLSQIQSYLTAMQRKADYELWPDGQYNEEQDRTFLGSDSFRRMLLDNHLPAPTSCLVVALGTENKRIGFEVIEWDEDYFESRNPALINMIDLLRGGTMPPPEFDGHAQECYWCQFHNDCPAVQKNIEDTSLDNILDALPTDSPAEDSIVNEIAQEYDYNRLQIKTLERQQEELKLNFERQLGNIKVRTDNYSVSYVEEQGRQIPDMEALRALAEQYNFEIPMTRAKASKRMRVTALKGETADR